MNLMARFVTRYLNFWPVILLLLFALSFLYQTDLSFSQDLGRHLKLGEIIWSTKQVPLTNLFSYTQADQPFVNHHWLFEVILYLSNSLVGLNVLLVLKIILLVTCIMITLLSAQKTQTALLIPVSFVFLHLLRTRTDLRPELISFLFTVLTLFILNRFVKSGSKIIYLLPLITLIWVNSHIYFPIGIFILIIFIGSFFYEKKAENEKSHMLDLKIKRSLIALSISIFATLINPNFMIGAIYPFVSLSHLGVTTAENQNIFSLQQSGYKNADFLFYYFTALLIIVSIFVNLCQSKIKIREIGLSLLGLGLATQAIREFPFLFFISLPAVLANFDYTKTKYWTQVLGGIVIFLMCVEAFFYLSGNYSKLTYHSHSPELSAPENWKGALDFVLDHKLPGPILNNFEIGNYIFYRGYPQYKVFADGRPEAYSVDFFDKVYNPTLNDEVHFNESQKKYGFKTIIFPINDQNPRTTNLFRRITNSEDWKVVYLDFSTIVVVSTDIQQNLNLKIIDTSNLNLYDYKFDNYIEAVTFSIFLFNIGNFEQAKIVGQKALDLAPDNPGANLTMANIILKQTNRPSDIYGYLDKSRNYVFW